MPSSLQQATADEAATVSDHHEVDTERFRAQIRAQVSPCPAAVSFLHSAPLARSGGPHTLFTCAIRYSSPRVYSALNSSTSMFSLSHPMFSVFDSELRLLRHCSHSLPLLLAPPRVPAAGVGTLDQGNGGPPPALLRRVQRCVITTRCFIHADIITTTRTGHSQYELHVS